MGTAIISGLTFATFLTLVIVPVMYSAFDSVSLRVTEAFGGNVEDAAIVSDTVSTDSPLDDEVAAGNGTPEAPAQATPNPPPAEP
jgi:hypothetical protein